MFEQVISVDRMEHAVSLFGSFDENIRQVEEEYSVKVISRGSDLKVSGEAENVAKATRAIEGLLTLINKGEALSEQNVRYVLSMVNEGSEDKLSEMVGDCICITAKGKPVKPKTLKAQNPRSEKICRGDSQKYCDARRRPCGHGQNLSCGRNGGYGVSR